MNDAVSIVRFQFEAPALLTKEIEVLENEAFIGSHREFFMNLLSLWRWAAKCARNGEPIGIMVPRSTDQQS